MESFTGFLVIDELGHGTTLCQGVRLRDRNTPLRAVGDAAERRSDATSALRARTTVGTPTYCARHERIPQIPGYSGGDQNTNLSSLWDRPAGGFPEALWPTPRLADIDPSPNGWLVVEEHFFAPEEHGGRGCVFVAAGSEEAALEDTTWVGRELGDFSVSSKPGGESGYDSRLVEDRDGLVTEFLIQARRPVGAPVPQIDVFHPFLWFWDAFEVPNGWNYVSAAGRDHELIRYERAEDSWKVEVRVLELRTFLRLCGKSAVVQVDYVTKVQEGEFERVDSDFHQPWAHVDFHAVADFLTGSERPSMSRIFGQYVLTGQPTSTPEVGRASRGSRDIRASSTEQTRTLERISPIRAIPTCSGPTSTRTTQDFTT